MQHAHVLAENPGQLRQQLARACDVAGNRVAYAHGDRGRRRLTFLDHVEMVVEGRDLVDLRHRKPHLVGERDQVRSREMSVVVLYTVQVFDEQVAPARRVFQESPHFLAGLGVDTAPFGRAAHPSAFCRLQVFRRRRSAVVHETILPPG